MNTPPKVRIACLEGDAGLSRSPVNFPLDILAVKRYVNSMTTRKQIITILDEKGVPTTRIREDQLTDELIAYYASIGWKPGPRRVMEQAS